MVKPIDAHIHYWNVKYIKVVLDEDAFPCCIRVPLAVITIPFSQLSKMPRLIGLVTAAALFSPLCSAWGNLGHEIVGYVAQDFVSAATKTYVENILGSSTTSYMAAVATWADTYRYTTAGAWSEPLHFIDANDKYVAINHSP